MSWFSLRGDERLGRCASEGCAGQPIFRLEAEGVGSNYCSGCRAKIEAREDARMFGVGFTREYPDGRIERVPPEQVVMFNRPNTQED